MTVVYTSDPQLRHPRALLRQAWGELVVSRALAWRLLKRNLRARYGHTALGYVWLLLPPLVTAALWVTLRATRVIDVQATAVPYPVYVLTGIFVWQAFLRLLNTPLQQFNASRSLLTRIKFPWDALLLAGIGEAVFELLVYLMVLAGVFAFFRMPMQWSMLLALPAMGILLLSGLTLGLFLTPWGMLYDDVPRLLNLVTPLLFFLVPIVYAPPTTYPGTLLMTVNPLAILVITTRDLSTTGQSPNLLPFLLIAALLLPLLAVGWLLYRLSIPHLIARLGN